MGHVERIKEGAGTLLLGDVCGWACCVVCAPRRKRDIHYTLGGRMGGGGWGGISSWLRI